MLRLKKRFLFCLLFALTMQILMTGCAQDIAGNGQDETAAVRQDDGAKKPVGEETAAADGKIIPFSEEIQELEEGLTAVQFTGNYGFDDFLAQGGASRDSEVAAYLRERILSDIPGLVFGGNPFGCSTLSVENKEGGYLFGRNFDWNDCNAMIIRSEPENGYASVSTVNTDFIQAGGVPLSKLPDHLQAAVGMYAPLDGMNEKGFAVSVNMIEDSDTIEQNTDKPDITTTTAVRLLLNRAADVQEAVSLLEQYDMHASMGMMVHFALADKDGRSVVVEYINHEMVVTPAPVVTNYYLAEGEKYGTGTAQSHIRFDILDQSIRKHETMSETEVKDALDSVSKDNFDGYESTEWSIVMNQSTGKMTYYHRENYKTDYTFSIT